VLNPKRRLNCAWVGAGVNDSGCLGPDGPSVRRYWHSDVESKGMPAFLAINFGELFHLLETVVSRDRDGSWLYHFPQCGQVEARGHLRVRLKAAIRAMALPLAPK